MSDGPDPSTHPPSWPSGQSPPFGTEPGSGSSSIPHPAWRPSEPPDDSANVPTREQLVTALKSIRGKRVAVIGDVIHERRVSGHWTPDSSATRSIRELGQRTREKARLAKSHLQDLVASIRPDEGSESEPAPDLNALHDRAHAGGAATVALQARALGAETHLITRLGNDFASDQVVDALGSLGIPIDGPRLGRLPARERFFAGGRCLLSVDGGGGERLDEDAERELFRQIDRLASEGLDAVLLLDGGYGTLPTTRIHRLMPMLRFRVPMIAADLAGPATGLNDLAHLDLIAPTERRLRDAVQDASLPDASLDDILAELMPRQRIAHVMVHHADGGYSLASLDPHEPTKPIARRRVSMPDGTSARLGAGRIPINMPLPLSGRPRNESQPDLQAAGRRAAWTTAALALAATPGTGHDAPTAAALGLRAAQNIREGGAIVTPEKLVNGFASR